MQNPRTRRAGAPSGTAAEVVNSSGPSRTCARAVCNILHTEHTHTGDILSKVLSDRAHAHVRARAIPEEVVEAWRERIFGELKDDPIKFAVEAAMRTFPGNTDFRLWAWYANRIGVNNFVNLYFEVQSLMRNGGLNNPAAAFQSRLKRFLAAMQEAEAEKRASKEGGAR